jgi:hypothetical protein
VKDVFVPEIPAHTSPLLITIEIFLIQPTAWDAIQKTVFGLYCTFSKNANANLLNATVHYKLSQNISQV